MNLKKPFRYGRAFLFYGRIISARTVGNGLDRSVFKNNPSVTFGDSSLYTREPTLFLI